MKKRNLYIILLLLICALFVNYKVNATSGTDDTNKATYTVTETKQSQVMQYVSCSYFSDYGTCAGETLHVSLLQQKCNEEELGTKVVAWTAPNSTNSGYTKMTIAELCKNYETNHPGWLVLGGINGDQYTLKNGTDLHVSGSHPYVVQPYYPMIMDYEKVFSNTWMQNNLGSNGRFIGLLNDGSKDPLCVVNASVSPTYLVVEVLNNNEEVIATYPASSLNGTGETVVYSGLYSETELGTFVPNEVIISNLFVVEDAEMAYCNNSSSYTLVGSTQDAFFGKGTITKKTLSAKLGLGQFAVSTTNAELLEYLNVGVKIRCEYIYTEESYNLFESGVGFHTIQCENGVDNTVSGSYNTGGRTRSIIGRKSNGTVVLMVIDDYNDTYGTTGYGINAICKAYNIVDAYQMDGGGSSQMAVRQSNGTFSSVTYSADSNTIASQRKVFNGVLFVVKDPNYKEECNVKYMLNGGSLNGETLSGVYTSFDDLELPTPTLEGYVFDNWYLDNTFTALVDNNISGDVTIYANYYMLGDIDKDNIVDLLDCLLAQIYLSEKKEKDRYVTKVMDYNQDGEIDVNDIRVMQKKLVE